MPAAINCLVPPCPAVDPLNDLFEAQIQRTVCHVNGPCRDYSPVAFRELRPAPGYAFVRAEDGRYYEVPAEDAPADSAPAWKPSFPLATGVLIGGLFTVYLLSR